MSVVPIPVSRFGASRGFRRISDGLLTNSSNTQK
jgi:hypothetical protein